MIHQLNKSTKAVIREFDSAADAARFLGVDGSGIRRCLRGEYATAYGYMWAEADTEKRCRARRAIELHRRLEAKNEELGIGVEPILESEII